MALLFSLDDAVLASASLRPPASAYWAFAGMTLVWGSTWHAIHLQLNGTPMFVSIALRFALAALVLASWMRAKGYALTVPRGLWPVVLVQGLSVYGVNYLFAYAATAHVASGVVALVFALNVVVSLLLEPWLTGQRSAPGRWLAAGLGVAGLALVLLPGSVDVRADGRSVGIALALGGAICVGLGNVLSSRLLRQGASLPALNFWGFVVGTAVASIAASLGDGGWRVVPSPIYLASLLYLAVFGSVLAFACYLHVVRTLGPVPAAYSSVLSPVIALLLSGWLEGLALTPTLAGGLLLVVLGNVLVLRGRSLRRRADGG